MRHSRTTYWLQGDGHDPGKAAALHIGPNAPFQAHYTFISAALAETFPLLSAIGDVQSFADRHRRGNEFRQVLKFLEVTRDLLGMGQDIVSQQQDIPLQFWQQKA